VTLRALAPLAARVAAPAKPPPITRADVEAALAHCTDGADDLEARLREVFVNGRPPWFGHTGGGWRP
jgi:hypothetical protein